MSTNRLKEFIHLVIEAKKSVDQEKLLRAYLKKTPKEHFSWDERQLMKHGMLPIPRNTAKGKSVSFLGAGAYAHAYEVLWHGKRAVAKITSSEPDVQNAVELARIAAKLPERHARHIMDVYEVKSFKRRVGGDDETWWIVVVEMLSPLPASLARETWGVSSGDTKESDADHLSRLRLDHAYSSGKLAHTIAASITKTVAANRNFENVLGTSVAKNEKRNITDQADSIAETIIANKEFKDAVEELRIIVSGTFDMNRLTAARSWLLHSIMSIVNKKLATTDLHRTVASQLASDVAYVASVAVKNLVQGRHFPFAKEDELKHPPAETLSDPRAIEFKETLDYLADRGMEWSDLHGANVMVRAKTGDLVISDPGLFMDKRSWRSRR